MFQRRPVTLAVFFQRVHVTFCKPEFYRETVLNVRLKRLVCAEINKNDLLVIM